MTENLAVIGKFWYNAQIYASPSSATIREYPGHPRVVPRLRIRHIPGSILLVPRSDDPPAGAARGAAHFGGDRR
jgi:hypothetical protein